MSETDLKSERHHKQNTIHTTHTSMHIYVYIYVGVADSKMIIQWLIA